MGLYHYMIVYLLFKKWGKEATPSMYICVYVLSKCFMHNVYFLFFMMHVLCDLLVEKKENKI